MLQDEAVSDSSAVFADEVEDLYRRDGARLWRSLLGYTADRELATDAVFVPSLRELPRASTSGLRTLQLTDIVGPARGAQKHGFPEQSHSLSQPESRDCDECRRSSRCCSLALLTPRVPRGHSFLPRRSRDHLPAQVLRWRADFLCRRSSVTGCQTVRGLGVTRWALAAPGFWHALAKAMGLSPPGYSVIRGSGP